MVFSGRKPKGFLLAIICAIGFGLIGYGIWGLWQFYRTTHNPHPVIPITLVTHSPETPDETKLDSVCQSYKVPAGEPRSIEIARIDLAGCLQKVGIDQYGAVAVPTNIHLAGWYANGPVPGSAGVSLIDGHVSGRYSADALFARLGEVRAGDMVRVQFGDGSWRSFLVVVVQNYPVAQASDELFKSLEGVERQLTLITCGGTYKPDLRTYTERVIVRTRALD